MWSKLGTVESNKQELENQMERNWERLQRLKEKRKAEEEAKQKAEEEAARWAAEEEKQREEAAARAAFARRRDEEAAEKRRRIAASARGRQGPAPGEASTSCRQVEVEIPQVVRKGSSKQSVEAGDPDDGNDGSDEDEKAPCCWGTPPYITHSAHLDSPQLIYKQLRYILVDLQATEFDIA
ncbi:hypothetical protein F5876DRAFT_68516 [Lentinula aff. lateritia]|uniref:Uncharacterized protein n=1 Tax=Lentinula aff. lateritia TaxID=2804960 RepID=A0ACC1TQ99_9AGAR|nr:hypothetical protein F5876DRAFT_68516 [Lentinula aff. lateritia]